MNKIKNYGLSAVLTLCFITLSSCARIEHKESCVPTLSYELSENTEFVLMKMEGNIGDYLTSKKDNPWFITQMEHKYAPMNADSQIKLFHGEKITLTGKVLGYQKSPFSAFDTSGLFFSIEISGRLGWLSGASLRLISKDHPNINNQKNHQRLSSRFERQSKFKCIEPVS